MRLLRRPLHQDRATDAGLSMRMVLRVSETDWLLIAVATVGTLTGTNAGVFETLLAARRASLTQRRTVLALRPLSEEIQETDAPVSWNFAAILAFSSRENRRRRW